jgi:hypothetical protein
MRIRIQGAKSMQIHADLGPLFRIRTDPVELSQWIRIQAGKNRPKKEKMKNFTFEEFFGGQKASIGAWTSSSWVI